MRSAQELKCSRGGWKRRGCQRKLGSKVCIKDLFAGEGDMKYIMLQENFSADSIVLAGL
jgi:hypothetical protein